MKKHGAVIVAALALSGCTKDLPQAEVNEMLLQPTHGLMGGVDFGDSWDKIKADHDKRYTVRDEAANISGTPTPFRQLRHDLGSPGEDGFYITFQVDAQKKVEGYSVSIYGRKKNAVVVRQVLDDVIASFDKKVGSGHCGKASGGEGNSSSCRWDGKDGLSVELLYLEMSDPISGVINVSIHQPARK